MRPAARIDVVALVFGVLLSTLAGVALWTEVVGPVSPRVLTVAAPLVLVVVGIVGLALSRPRP